MNMLTEAYIMVQKARLLSFKKPMVKKVIGHDVRILISPKNGIIDDQLYLKGTYEKNILKLIIKNLKPQSTFLDIGANIGLHSLTAAKHCNKVLSFEPRKDLCEQFKKSIKINKINNITVFNKATGNENTKRTLYTTPVSAGGSSLIKHESHTSSTQISVVKLDSVIKERVGFVKMDVEGFEYETIKGMKELIKNFKPVMLIEFTPFLYERKEPGSTDKFIKLLINHGYEFADVETRKPITLKRLKQNYQTNILLT